MEPLYGSLDTAKRQRDGDVQRLAGSELCVFSLDKLPKYKALSYCWGNEDATCMANINGQAFPVRPNLHSFLLRYEKDTQPESGFSITKDWIFIDAICINQQDLAERSSQVALMGDLYRGAEEVVAWLGTDSDVGPDFANLSPDEVSDWQFRIDCFELELAIEAACRLLKRPRASRFDALTEDGRGIAIALVDPFLHQPFWSRLWIVQEFILAKKLTFWFKGLSISWKTLYQCLKIAYGPNVANKMLEEPGKRGVGDMFRAFDGTNYAKEELSKHDRGPQQFRVFLLMKEKLQIMEESQARKMDLSRAIKLFHSRQCSVKQDIVFGMLGMTASVLKVDYAMDMELVYRDALAEGLLEFRHRYEENELVWDDFELQSVYFAVNLAAALGLDMHDVIPLGRSFCYSITQQCLEYIGVPMITASKAWATLHRAPQFRQKLKFSPLESIRLKAVAKLPTLMHHAAAFGFAIETGTDKIYDFVTRDYHDDGWGVKKAFQLILNKRVFEKWRFEKLTKEIPEISTRAEALLNQIEKFPPGGRAVDLAEMALSHLHSEISRLELLEDDMSYDHLRYLRHYAKRMQNCASTQREALKLQKPKPRDKNVETDEADDLEAVMDFMANREDFQRKLAAFGDDGSIEHCLYEALVHKDMRENDPTVAAYIRGRDWMHELRDFVNRWPQRFKGAPYGTGIEEGARVMRHVLRLRD